MTEREFPFEPVLSGASSALFTVFAYLFAAVLGVCLGAWSAGWDIVGAESCISEFVFESRLGLRNRVGLSCFFAIGMLTLIYYKLDRARWESLNAMALLWTIYVYVAMGAGDAVPTAQTIKPPPVPSWRIFVSVAAIIAVYVAGRVALSLGWPRAPRSK